MNPIDCIENGILECNWDKVCEGFKLLTGKELSSPKDKSQQILNQIKQIMLQLQSGEEVVIEQTNKKEKKKNNIGRKKKKTNKKFTVDNDGKDPSLILDDGKKTPTQRELGSIQLITNEVCEKEVVANKIKAQRARENKIKSKRVLHKKYEAECNDCGDIFESDRPKGEIGQKCNKCLRSRIKDMRIPPK